MKALQINPSGAKQIVDIGGDTIEEQNDHIWDILDGYFDCVTLAHKAVMLVNDEGILKGFPVNLEAMRITGYPFIAGIALIFGTQDTDDGAIVVDVPAYYADFA